MAYKKETTRDPMHDESKIKGGGKKTGPVELFPLKAKKKLGGPPPVNV